MNYLSSKLTERQVVGEDEIFYNHAQLSAILEAKKIKRDTKLHKVIVKLVTLSKLLEGFANVMRAHVHDV